MRKSTLFPITCLLLLPLGAWSQQSATAPAISNPQPAVLGSSQPRVATPDPIIKPQTPAIPAPPIPANNTLIRRIAMIDIPGRPGFKGVAITNGCLVMAHPGASTVDVFSLAKRRVIATLKDMKGPSGIAVDEQGGRVFVANSDGQDIAVIGTKDWQLQKRIPLKSSPGALLFVPELNALYASNWRDQSISIVDLTHDAARDIVNVGGRPEDLAYDPAEKHVLASLEDVRQIAVLDPSLKLIKRIPLLASQPTGLALDPKARRLYVAVRHAVLRLDVDTGQELGRLAAPDGIDTLWLDQQSSNLFGAAVGGAVMLIKAGQGQFATAKEYDTEVRGHSLAFDPGKQMLYLPGGRDGRSKLLILRHLTAGEAATTKPEIARK